MERLQRSMVWDRQATQQLHHTSIRPIALELMYLFCVSLMPTGVTARPMASPLAVLAPTGGFWEKNPAVVGPFETAASPNSILLSRHSGSPVVSPGGS